MHTGFLPRTLDVDGVAYRYQVWLPPDYTEAREWPLLLFLHGAVERGDDGVRQTTVGLGPALLRDPERWPLVVVFPQCREAMDWRGPMLRQALGALDDATVEFRGDLSRQYLSGISLGGYGAWRLALEQPDRFAALVPVCGGLDAPTAEAGGETRWRMAARRIAQVPEWVFHGDLDRVIAADESRRMVKALEEAGADVRYTEYAGVGHNSWDAAYAEPELPEWLLRQRRHG